MFPAANWLIRYYALVIADEASVVPPATLLLFTGFAGVPAIRCAVELFYWWCAPAPT